MSHHNSIIRAATSELQRSGGALIDSSCPDLWFYYCILHGCGTNMEQFASWSDVIKYQANLQN